MASNSPIKIETEGRDKPVFCKSTELLNESTRIPSPTTKLPEDTAPTSSDEVRRSREKTSLQQHRTNRPHSPVRYHPHITHYGQPTYIIDSRNGLAMDRRFAMPTTLEGHYAYHPPIPLDARTHEGRYHFEPHMMHHPIPGHTHGASPVLSDISIIRVPSQRSGTSHPESPIYPYYQYMDSPTLSALSHARGLSPSSHGHPGTYLPHVVAFPPRSSEMTAPPSTAGSIEHPSLEFASSVEGSRFNSPKPSARLSRKRALSISPFAETVDINAMIRTSPNSLVAYINNSGSSSSASGSYGHLSAGTVSPMNWHHSVTPIAHLQQLQHQLMRHGSGNPYLSTTTPARHLPSHCYPHSGVAALFSHGYHVLPLQDPAVCKSHHHHHHAHQSYPTEVNLCETNNNVVSSTVDPDSKRTRIKEEPFKSPASIVSSTSAEKLGNIAVSIKDDDMKHEEEIPPVTDCEWGDCNLHCNTLEKLVIHINNDHIHNEKKEFICRWRDCIREEKPFKAQYMLVVHMRRHTGEKPHKCTFEGCNKAYSRLENLKTHLRSHTGERPYVCEFQGCTKAFSNASDRAKHQNRTHSNAKPYVCKILGCTKRYTDPSSLRKHVKTVHGPDAHVTKKHRSDKKDPGANYGSDKSNDSHNNIGNDIGMSGRGKDGEMDRRMSTDEKALDHSPQALEVQGLDIKPLSVQSDDLIHSYGWSSSDLTPVAPEGGSSPHNDSGVEMTMTAEDDKIQDNHISSNMDSINGNSGGGTSTAHSVRIGNAVKLGRKKVKSTTCSNRMARVKKIVPALPTLPTIRTTRSPKPQDKTIERLQGEDGNRCDSSQSFVGNLESLAYRRSSNTSNGSSYFSSSRCSSDASPFPSSQFSSRRSSEASTYMSSRRTSGASLMSNRMSVLGSPYDPISVGSSRKSSGASMMSGPTGVPGLSVQQQNRLQAKYDHVIYMQNHRSDDRCTPSPIPTSSRRCESAGVCFPLHTPLPHEVPNSGFRRASDPVRCNRRNALPIPPNMKTMMGTKLGIQGIRNMCFTSPTPNAIPENCAMETDAMADDMVLPDDTMPLYMSSPKPNNNSMNYSAMNDMVAEQHENRGNPQYNHMIMTQQQSCFQYRKESQILDSGMNGRINNGVNNEMNNGMQQNYNMQQLQMRSNPVAMEMSPDCNKVTSTVDIGPNPSVDTLTIDCNDPMVEGLASLSTDGMDHVEQLIPDESLVHPTRNLVSEVVSIQQRPYVNQGEMNKVAAPARNMNSANNVSMPPPAHPPPVSLTRQSTVTTQAGLQNPNMNMQMRDHNMQNRITNMQMRDSNIQNGMMNMQMRDSNMQNGMMNMQMRDSNMQNGMMNMQMRDSNMQNGMMNMQMRDSNMQNGMMNMQQGMTNSGMSTPNRMMTPSSNMVVNDMSSMLSTLAEENKYLDLMS